MPVTLGIIAGGIGIASSIGKIGYGIGQDISGNNNLKNLEANRPQRTTDPSVLYNQKLAQVNAAGGLPDATRNEFERNVNRNLSQSIQASLQGGGDINSVNKLFDTGNNEYLKLASLDAEQHQKNQQPLYAANNEVARQNQLNNDWNTFIPYEQQYSRAVQQTTSGASNITGGATDLSKNAFGLASSLGNRSDSDYNPYSKSSINEINNKAGGFSEIGSNFIGQGYDYGMGDKSLLVGANDLNAGNYNMYDYNDMMKSIANNNSYNWNP